jgi:hypothetical protein
MVKVILLLCVMAAALVCAKPSGKQEESNVVTFLNLIHERPNRLVDVSTCDTATLTLLPDFACFSKSGQKFSCDGTSCFNMPNGDIGSLKVCFLNQVKVMLCYYNSRLLASTAL